LTVAKPNQIAPAIKTIIDDNRKMYVNNDGTFAITKHETPRTTPQPTIVPLKEEQPKPVVATKVDTPKVIPVVPKVEDKVIVERKRWSSINTTKPKTLRRLATKKVVKVPPQRKASPPIAQLLFTP